MKRTDCQTTHRISSQFGVHPKPLEQASGKWQERKTERKEKGKGGKGVEVKCLETSRNQISDALNTYIYSIACFN